MTVPTIEAQGQLLEIIHGLRPGEEVVVTEGGTPVAQVKKAEAPAKRSPRKAGNCQGMLVIVSDDDDHLKDFAEYME
jgi:antitoxin (DNA-binding transcriptional repressor) of toxin-antitoxin stability system